MIGSSSNRHSSFKDSLSCWLRMLTPNYTYCAIIKFRWIVLGGRPGLAREAEKISTRFEMENKKRKLFDTFAWRDRCEGVLSSGIRECRPSISSAQPCTICGRSKLGIANKRSISSERTIGNKVSGYGDEETC
jgi:hypothetical protein